MSLAQNAIAQARCFHQAGNWQRAEQLYRQVVQAEPGNATAWKLLGDVLQAARNLPEAVAAYRRTLELSRDDPETLFGLASALAEQGHREPAADVYRQLLRVQPAHGEALTQLGVLLAELGRLHEALLHLREAVRVRPDFARAWHNLGVALAQSGKSDEARDCLEKALTLQPAYAEACFNLGNVLGTLGRREDAIAQYRRALELRPDHGGAWNNLGLALTEAGRPAEGVVVLQQAVRLRPQAGEAHMNLGLAHAELGRFKEAETSYQEALRLNPSYVEAHTNLGNTYKEQGRLDEALACYQIALWLDPNSASTHYNRSLALLQAGDYERGWPAYEWRWRRPKQKTRTFSRPRWDGSDLRGRTILLWCEQGLGDTIQFVRYAALVKARGGKVVLECPGFLIPLLSTCAGTDRLVAEGEALPDYDVQAPLLSLPGLCGTTSLEKVPAPIPYLHADPGRAANWRQRLDEFPGFKVGIAWQGNPHHQWDRWRSIPLEHFAPLAAVEGVHLISLQKVFGTEQLALLDGRFSLINLAEELDADGSAFLDTAAVLKNLDLVVTVDTVTGHLAGALGAPVWLALSQVADWRWLLLRPDTPWYPTMRFFRQERLNDWAELFNRLEQALRRLVAAPIKPSWAARCRTNTP